MSARALRGLGFPPPTAAAPSRLRAFAEAYGAAYRRASDGRVWLAPSALDAIERGAPSIAHAKLAEHLDAIVAWLDVQEGDQTEALIAGVFADDWMRQEGFPIGRVAQDPARYAAPRQKRREREPDVLAGARVDPALLELEREREQAAARARAEWAEPTIDVVAMLRGAT